MQQRYIKKIAVFRALQIGDMLCAVPAFRALRNANPKAEITLIGLPWASEFVKRFSMYIDRHISFPGYPGLIEQPYALPTILEFIHKMQQEKFDVVLQMHGNGSIINPLMFLFGAKTVAGFYRKEDYCPNEKLFCEYPELLSEKERLLSLLDFLHIPRVRSELEFPITSEDIKNFSANFYTKYIKKPYVIIHPGARDIKRRWSLKFFVHIADALTEHGYHVVFTGSYEEKNLVEKIALLTNYPTINTSGKTSLGDLALLIRSASLVVANCTSVAHIADALKTPSVIIYLSSDPVRWGAEDTFLHRRILPKDTITYTKVLNQSLSLLSKFSKQNLHNRKGVIYETE